MLLCTPWRSALSTPSPSSSSLLAHASTLLMAVMCDEDGDSASPQERLGSSLSRPLCSSWCLSTTSANSTRKPSRTSCSGGPQILNPEFYLLLFPPIVSSPSAKDCCGGVCSVSVCDYWLFIVLGNFVSCLSCQFGQFLTHTVPHVLLRWPANPKPWILCVVVSTHVEFIKWKGLLWRCLLCFCLWFLIVYGFG